MDDWKEQLPEDLRSTALIQEASSFESVAKQAVDFQRQMGSMMRIPGPDASDEVKQEFRGKMEKVGMVPLDGYTEYVRPKEAEHYSLEVPPADAVELGLTQGTVDQWKNEAWEDGLSQNQFQNYAQRRIDNIRYEHDKRRADYQTKEQALKDKWGLHGYEPAKQRALAAAMRFGKQPLYEHLKDNPDPLIMEAFGEIGKEFEEKGMGDLEQPLSLPETKDEAAVKLDEILSNPQHPFNNMSVAGKAQYEAAAREVMRLRRILAGEPASVGDDLFAA